MEIRVKGMKCSGCEERIKRVLKTIDGVLEVEANHETGLVKIKTNKEISLDLVKEKLTNLDFEVE